MSEPTIDDMADTISANLRTMRTVGIRLDALASAVKLLTLIVCIIVLFALVSDRKLWHGIG